MKTSTLGLQREQHLSLLLVQDVKSCNPAGKLLIWKLIENSINAMVYQASVWYYLIIIMLLYTCHI